MDFSLSEEQTMLADSVARFIDNDYGFEQRMQIAESDAAFSKEHWQTFAELGWTAMLFAEQDGGFDGGAVETMLIMEQFGRGLVVEPFIANILLAGGVLKRAADDAQKSDILARIIEGTLQTALAFAEPQARFNIANVASTAKRGDDGFVLNGRKTLVLNGGDAELIIVPARTSGEQLDRDGISLFAVPADASGMVIRSYQTVDAHAGAELAMDDVAVSDAALIGSLGGGFDALQGAVDDATLAVCAEAVGIMRQMHDKTVEYSKSRAQFGVPIGSFQALQHRMVDTLMHCEQSRSLMLWAVMMVAENNPKATRAVSALKHQVGTAGRKVAQEAVQIHGGMGVTWELDVAHYFKRHSAIETLFGNSDYHLERYIASA